MNIEPSRAGYPFRPVLLALYLFLSFAKPTSSYAQYDTVPITPFFTRSIVKDTTNREGVRWRLVRGKAFPALCCNFLSGLLFSKELHEDWDPQNNVLTIREPLEIFDCTNYTGQLSVNGQPQALNAPKMTVQCDRRIFMSRSHFPSPSAVEFNHLISHSDVNIQQSEFYSLLITESGGSFEIIYDTIAQNVDLLADVFQGPATLSIADDTFASADSRIYIANSLVDQQVEINDNEFKHLQITLSNDSLEKPVVIWNSPKRQPRGREDVTVMFENCYVNDKILIGKIGPFARIIFRNCRFGPQASTLNLVADTVRFENCNTLPANLSLQLYPNNKICWLNLSLSNLTNVSFYYNPYTRLAFDTTLNAAVDADTYTSNYESLLAKFKSENKMASYQFLDIEHQNSEAKRGNFWDKALNVLNEAWWDYGYDKKRVFLWTVLFLLAFFLANIILWTQVQEIYTMPLELNFIDSTTHPWLFHLQKGVNIFLYTAYVFFSVKIELPKLRIGNLLMVGYFLLQYLVGLGCLFFIVTVLLKFA